MENKPAKISIVMSSEPARKKFQENLLKLQNMEMMYQKPIEQPIKPKQNA